tara:strand:- start:49 stop:420 length:372 start_codon:yes stop_codon:yes gene_type:complete
MAKAIKTKTDKEQIVKILRMRSRDFRNGVLNVLPLKHDKIVSKEMWDTMASISDLMVTLNEQLVKNNGLGDNKIDASIQTDMTELTETAKHNMLTPTERKAKAKAVADIQKQIDALMATKATL